MDLRKRYLTYVALAFVPQLYGCLWDSIHVDGTLDASNKAEEVSPANAEEISTEKEDDK